MRSSMLVLIFSVSVQAATPAAQRMFDTKLTAAQRNDACFELRGDKSPDTLDAMLQALSVEVVRNCAGENLRVAEALPQLRAALSGNNPEIRALAARELGSFQKPELLEALAEAARDPNLLVAVNAVAGLSQYEDAGVFPYLEALAVKGGMLGVLSLSRLGELKDPRALDIARTLLSGREEVTDRVAAMRVIGELGDRSDLPALRKIAAQTEGPVAARQRGFGLMPQIDLARTARATIAQIEKRAHR